MKIDSRGLQDIEARIGELAKSYTPEWNFDTSDSDIGSVIARLFAVQMNENIDLENRMLERYHAEFINMLDLSLKPAKPAGSMVKFELADGAGDGTYVRAGTRLVTDGMDGDQVIFETDRDVYVTNSRITDAFMTDREDRTFVPLLGDFPQVKLVDGVAEVTEDEPPDEDTVPEQDEGIMTQGGTLRRIRPFVLFSEDGNIARSALVMYHESLFDIEDEPIYVKLTGNEQLMDSITDGKYIFTYFTKKGYTEFDSVRVLDDRETVELIKHEKNRHIIIGGRSYGIIVMMARDTVLQDKELRDIGLSSSGGERDAEFVSDGSDDMNVKSFAPFTDTLSVYNECYIGHNLYFKEAGAQITVRFRTRFGERGLYLTRHEEEAELKIIKKKPKVLPADIPADAYADGIGLEYFNGQGWKTLNCIGDFSQIFKTGTASETVMTFICPKDWEETQAGAYTGRTIRMRLLRSDNCFLRPCIHHYPVIEDLKISFTYEGHFVNPTRLFRIAGTQKKEITTSLKTGKAFTAFSGGDYADDALYLGFDEKMTEGPVSIYFELDDVTNMKSMKCCYEYSAPEGFRRMKVFDNTRDFSRSGAVFFMPPADMFQKNLEGRSRFWIRVRREYAESETENPLFLPRIRNIMLNVVNVSNIVTGNEENHYISEVIPNQRVALSSGNILDAEVWVNERDTISREEIERIEKQQPENIRIERDRLGKITSVFVKWHETDSFLSVKDRRSYLIDRFTGELVFSDGIKADMPRVIHDVSLIVRPRMSDGEAGNVSPYSINQTVFNGLYIDSVYNPVRAYGGSNMETMPEALKRGANLLYGRGRLVTTADYIFTILAFSRSIDKAACVPGETVGKNASSADISFVLLMKDYKDGSFSFHRIQAPLKKHLVENSPMTVSPDHIFIVEPVFVTVSVTVWAEVTDMELSFEAQSLITRTLDDYFDPVTSADHEGWDIGVIPKKSQIMMKLASLKSDAIIKNMSIIAHYVDSEGEHEIDLQDLKVSPFMAVVSGEHRVNIQVSGE